MKTILYVAAIVLLAAFPVQATTIWSYDFNHLNTGSIEGQDNWVWSGFTGWQNLQVASVLKADGNNSKAITGPVDVLAAHGDYRTFAPGAGYTYTTTDTTIVQSFEVFTGTYPQTGTLSREATGGLHVGTMIPGPTGANIHQFVFGILAPAPSNSAIKTTFRALGSGTNQYGDVLANDHWYDIRLVIDFSTLKGSLEYRDLTAGDLTYTPDSLLKDKALGIAVGTGSYTFTGLKYRLQGGTIVDNFKLGDSTVIPEPSTLTLLAAGLVGLLAYAWRKRK